MKEGHKTNDGRQRQKERKEGNKCKILLKLQEEQSLLLVTTEIVRPLGSILKIVTGSPHEKLRVSILFCYTFITII